MKHRHMEIIRLEPVISIKQLEPYKLNLIKLVCYEVSFGQWHQNRREWDHF